MEKIILTFTQRILWVSVSKKQTRWQSNHLWLFDWQDFVLPSAAALSDHFAINLNCRMKSEASRQGDMEINQSILPTVSMLNLINIVPQCPWVDRLKRLFRVSWCAYRSPWMDQNQVLTFPDPLRLDEFHENQWKFCTDFNKRVWVAAQGNSRIIKYDHVQFNW